MLPNIADVQRPQASGRAASRWPRGVGSCGSHVEASSGMTRTLRDLDELLFAPGDWFALGADNRRVPGVVVPSLEQGLGLVGHGAVASVVGRLRAEVRVVDVDLAGECGYVATKAAIAWCVNEGLWHLVRPSGGPDGRHHVFVACAGRVDDLEAVVEGLRAELGVSPRRLEVRVAVRPLSAPHRTGVVTRPSGSLSAALGGLRGHPWAQDMPQRVVGGSERVGAVIAAVPARHRARRDLPGEWQAYLDTGVAPAVAGEDQSRSTIEAIATGFLLRVGHDADSAWQVITTAHEDAFAKARGSRRRWVAWVWNRAVTDDAAFSPAVEVDGHLQLDVSAAEDRLVDLAWTMRPRARRALLRVGYAVLDRVLRTGNRRVPVPERDLVLDTGLTDRKTVRAALRALNGHIGALDTSTLDNQQKDSSSYEFEISTTDQGGVLQIPPPSLHTPLPPGVWLGLPAAAHQLWRALNRAPGPTPLEEVAVFAQLTEDVTTPPSLSQVRAVRATLTRLAQVGLAQCTEAGEWVARHDIDQAHLERAASARSPVQAQIDAERAAYRAGSSSEWDVQRAAALKANLAREQAWWDGLPRDQRARRREACQGKFASMSVIEQEEWKASQVQRRHRAGVDEATRHQQWADRLPWDDVVTRSTERADAFARLPTPLRQAYAAAWARHRDRHGVPRGTPTWHSRLEHAHALPRPGQDRDEQFWADQLSVTSQEVAVAT